MGWRLMTGLIALTLLIAGGRGDAASESRHASGLEPVAWSCLRFRAAAFMSKASIDVTLEPLVAAEVEPHFLSAGDRQVVSPPGAQIRLISSHIVVDHFLWPTEDVSVRAWFAPENAAALQRVWTRSGAKMFIKRYRFTRQGVYRNRSEPETGQEAELDWKQWTNIKERFFPHPNADCALVTDPLVLLYVVSAAPGLIHQQPLQLCAFHKKRVHRVRLIPRGKSEVAVNYTERTRTAERRRSANIQTVNVSVNAEPLDPSADAVDRFSFLGLRGDITIYLDPRSGIPVQVSGDIPVIGRVDFKLLEAWLSANTNGPSCGKWR